MDIKIKFKKTIFFSIVLLILLTNFSVGIQQNIARADGPTQITTWAELDNVRNNLSGDYILMNDLDETTAGYDTYASSTANAGAGWNPVGTQANPFIGSFDGDGHIISDLFINRPAGSRIGLFGYSGSGVIFNNIGLEGVNITGRDMVGSLLGDSFDSSISNSYSTGNIIGINNYVGGLVGNAFGNISNSYSTASVSASNTVGGLVGKLFAANISNSYSIGFVSGSSSVGGLVGSNTSGSVTNSFYDSQTSGQSDAGRGTPKTTSEMKTQSAFTNAGWNFATIWAMGSGLNSGYAYLQSLPPTAIWTLTYTAGENGSITGDVSQSVDNGENGTAVTAVPNEGYFFVNWSDESTSNPRMDTNATEDISVTANFAIDTHTLTYTAGENGSIAGDVSQSVDNGEDGTAVTAVPNEGYSFVSWSDESTDNPRTDINVTTDIAVTASFAVDEVDEEEEATPEEIPFEPDRAKITSWSAEKYTDSNKSCSERLKITIKGKHFDDDAEVFIGGKEAASVNVKNSKNLTAKFCLEKLLSGDDHKRKITVKNPDADTEEADEQIDLDKLSSKNETANTETPNDYYDQKTKEGARHIQEALNKSGYLDAENITGTYGSITTEAVKKFQSDNGIESTGFVGRLTKAKLAEKVT